MKTISDSQAGFVQRLLSLWSIDFIVILLFLVVSNGTLLVVEPQSSFIRLVLAGPILLFLPGYVLVTALFPWSSLPDRPAERANTIQYCELSGPERAGLSFGLSMVLLPLFGVLIGASGWTPTADRMLLLLSAFIALGTIAGAIRRLRVPATARFRVPFNAWVGALGRFLRTAGWVNVAVNAALVVSVVVATVSVGYAFAAPQDGEQYSTLQLLTETEQGEYVTGNYPDELQMGEQQDLVVRIENHEQSEVEYSVVARIERLDNGTNSTRIQAAEKLWETNATVANGETYRNEHTLTPEMAGEDLRISYYLYRGDAPETPSPDSADQHVYLWVDVTEPT